MKLLKSLSLALLCFSSVSFAMPVYQEPEYDENEPLLMWKASQRSDYQEQEEIIDTALTRRQKIAEMKKMHEKIVSRQRRNRTKNARQRNLIGYQDTHLGHNGHRR
jgi:hypothetical protein